MPREDLEEALLGFEEYRTLVVLFHHHLVTETKTLVHPRGDESRPLRGVFTTGSPNRCVFGITFV